MYFCCISCLWAWKESTVIRHTLLNALAVVHISTGNVLLGLDNITFAVKCGVRETDNRVTRVCMRSEPSSWSKPQNFSVFFPGFGKEGVQEVCRGKYLNNKSEAAVFLAFVLLWVFSLSSSELSIKSNYTILIISREIYLEICWVREVSRGLN